MRDGANAERGAREGCGRTITWAGQAQSTQVTGTCLAVRCKSAPGLEALSTLPFPSPGPSSVGREFAESQILRSKPRKGRAGTSNIQHPTSNLQRLSSGRSLDVGRSMLDVGCFLSMACEFISRVRQPRAVWRSSCRCGSSGRPPSRRSTNRRSWDCNAGWRSCSARG